MSKQPAQLTPQQRKRLSRTLDPRVARTRKQLRQALIDLTIEKGFENITIREIAERADVGFKTFYRHYANRQALMNDVIQAFCEELVDQLDLENSSPDEQYLNGVKVFEYVRANESFCRVLIDPSVFSLVLDPLLDVTAQAMASTSVKSNAGEIPNDLLAHHVLWSVIGLIRWWLEAGLMPAEAEMAKYYVRLAKYG